MTNIEQSTPKFEYEWQNPNQNKFDFGRVFTRTFNILKLRGVKMMVLSTMLLGIPFMLMSIWPMFLSGGLGDIVISNDPDALSEIFTGGLIAVLVFGGLLVLLATLWLQPALIKISYTALTEEDLPTTSVLKQMTRFVMPVLGFYIIYIFAVLFGIILLVIPALFIALGWMLAGHIIVLEGQGVMDSISRSWTLTKGSKRWLLLLAVVIGVIGSIVGAIVAIPIYLMGSPEVAIIEGASLGYWIVNGVLSTISQVITTVLGVAWATAAYVELRKIREGVDPESKVSVFN